MQEEINNHIDLSEKRKLKERLREVNQQLNALLKLGSNDETLVDEKRSIQKQLKQK